MAKTATVQEVDLAPSVADTASHHRKHLSLNDRCDRCGAQAFVAVEMKAGELLFCGHHFHEYKTAITPQAVFIFDNTAAINAKPTSGVHVD